MAIEDTDGDPDVLPFPSSQRPDDPHCGECDDEAHPFPTKDAYDRYFDFEMAYCQWTRQVPHIMKFREWQRHILSLPAEAAQRFIAERRDSPQAYIEQALKEAM